MSSNRLYILEYKSICCILVFSFLLLIIAGDVELNPGPGTLSDKPTKDELGHLCSSQFTEGSWEHFVCHLPNMSQKVIDDIKQCESPDNVVSAVAQHWLDNSENPTWSEVINTLRKINEISLVQYVQETYIIQPPPKECHASETGNVQQLDGVIVTLKKVFKRNYAYLKNSSSQHTDRIASEMYSKNLITKPVRESSNFDAMCDEFEAGMMPNDISKLEEHCQLFIQSFSRVGGHLIDVVKILAEEWTQEVADEHGLSLCLTDQSTAELKINSKDQISVYLESLKNSFSILLMNIREYYDECDKRGKYKIINIARLLTEEYGEPFTDLKNIDDIFNKLYDQYYDFLNYELLVDLVKVFPLDSKLQNELDEYIKKHEEFQSSTMIQNLKENIEQALPRQGLSKDCCKITIKLCEKWREKNIKSFRKLIHYLFDKQTKILSLIDIIIGSITVILQAPASQAKFLIQIAESKNDVMCHLGVLELIINNLPLNLKPLSDDDEITDNEFTFEVSLLYAIKNSDKGEYRGVALLLIDFEIDLKFQNEEGETAEKLASAGGYTDILTALHDAEKFASTIDEGCMTNDTQKMPQTITAQESFALAIFCASNMADTTKKENVQQLILKFQTLSNSFTVALTAAVNEGQVPLPDLMHYLKLYEIECSDIEQLVILLQYYYSYLNVSLMNDISWQFLGQEIQNQVESYVKCELGPFESTTQLLELKMATEKTPIYPFFVDKRYAKLTIKFNSKWSYRTIADLHRFEWYALSKLHYYLNLNQVYQEGSLLVCAYFIPITQYHAILAAINDQQNFMTQLGICEVFIDDQPIIVEDDNNQFTFEAALQRASETDDETNIAALSFLFDINISVDVEENQANLADIDDVLGQQLETFQNIQKEFEEGFPTDWTNKLSSMITSGNKMSSMFPQYLQLMKNFMDQMQDQDILQSSDEFLILACLCKNHRVIHLLIENGANVNTQENLENLTPLLAACSAGDKEIIDLLLKNGADLNVQNNDGLTPLMMACSTGNYQIVDHLLKVGADINLRSNEGITATMATIGGCAFLKGSFLFQSVFDIDTETNPFKNLIAVEPEYLLTLELLLDAGPDLVANFTNMDEHFHLVVLAVISLDALKIVLRKCQISVEDMTDAFIMACCLGDSSIITFLFDQIPSTSDTLLDKPHRRELLVAIVEGDLKIIMDKIPANPDTPTVDTITPLMVAASLGQTEIVDTLIKFNANVNAWGTFSKEKFSVLDIAEGSKNIRNNDQIIEILVKSGALSATSGTTSGSNNIFQNILKSFSDIVGKNHQTSSGLPNDEY